MRMSSLPGTKASMGKEDRVKIRGLDTSSVGMRGRNRNSALGGTSGLVTSSSEEDLDDQLRIHLSGGNGNGVGSSNPNSRNSTIKGGSLAAGSQGKPAVSRKRSLAKSKSHGRLSISTAGGLAGQPGERPQISPRKASLGLPQHRQLAMTGSGGEDEDRINRRRAVTTDPRDTLGLMPADADGSNTRDRSRSSTMANSPLSSSTVPSPQLLSSRSHSTNSQAPVISPRSQAPGGSRASPVVPAAEEGEEGEPTTAGYFDVPVELPSRKSIAASGSRSVSTPVGTTGPGRASMESRGSVELEIERYLPGYGRSVSQASVRSGKSTPGVDGEGGHHGHHGFLNIFKKPHLPSNSTSAAASGSTSPNLSSAQATPSPATTPLASASGGYMNARLAREEERRLELEKRRERDRGRLVDVTREDKVESAGMAAVGGGKVTVKDGYKIIDGVEKKQSSSGVYTRMFSPSHSLRISELIVGEMIAATFPGVSGAAKPKPSPVYTPPSIIDQFSPVVPLPSPGWSIISSATSPTFQHTSDPTLYAQISPSFPGGPEASKRRSRFGSIGSIKGWKRASGEAVPMPEDAMQKVEEEKMKSISSPIASDVPIPQSARSVGFGAGAKAMDGVGLGFPLQTQHNRSVSDAERATAPQHPGLGERASSYSQVQQRSRTPSGPSAIYMGYQPEAITPIAESVPAPQASLQIPAVQPEQPARARNIKNLSLPLSSLHETVVQQEIQTAARAEAERQAAAQEEALRAEREAASPSIPASLGEAAKGTRRKPVPRMHA